MIHKSSPLRRWSTSILTIALCVLVTFVALRVSLSTHGQAVGTQYQAAGMQYYVSPTGSDANPGTRQSPFLTIQRAADAATSPGTIVHVAPGTYTKSSAIDTQVSGTSTARIVFISDIHWGAKIVVTGGESAWSNSGNYVDIVGFDITNIARTGRRGIFNEGSYDRAIGNHVHNLAWSSCFGSLGGAGIENAKYTGSDDDIIGNVVDQIGPAATTCTTVHGIYHSNLGGHIWNNVVYANAGVGIHSWHADNAMVIANNLVFGNRDGGILFGAGDEPGGVVTDNVVVSNNIAINNGNYGIWEYGAVGAHNRIVNNDVYGNAKGNLFLENGAASGTISVNPQFVNWQADGSGDYHLRSSSPLIDAGVSLGAPPTDTAGTARPQLRGYDIGPYEYAPPASSPTPTQPPAAVRRLRPSNASCLSCSLIRLD